MTTGEPLLTAGREVLDSYRREYDQLAAAFRDLDGKAQGTAAIAGGFLAAALAFVNQAGILRPGWSRAWAAVALVGLVLAIGFAMSSLRVRAVSEPPSGAEMALMVKDLVRIADPQDLAERLPFFYSDAGEMWRACLVTRRAVNLEKATMVLCSQRSLLFAAACVTCLVVLHIALD